MSDSPQRRDQHVRSVDEPTPRRGDTGALRQGAVDGLGQPHPTLFVSHHLDASARDLSTRSTGRNGVEESLGIRVHGFPLDCLASEVRLNVDVDVASACWRMDAPGGWPRSGMAWRKRSPNHSIASLWTLGGSSTFRPTGWWYILTNGLTIRSCAQLPLVRHVLLCPGCIISQLP